VQVSPELRDFICKLLEKDVLKRLDVQGALQVCRPLHIAQCWCLEGVPHRLDSYLEQSSL
jgi:hypothetical protein